MQRRKRIVILTEKARQVAEKYSAKESEFIERLYNGVTNEEIKSTYYFLAKLEENLNILNEEIIK